MTRFEKIHSLKTKIDLAYYLCYLHECGKCPVRFSCRERVNGFIPYLEEPDEYDYIMSLSLEALGDYFCKQHDCEHCPAAHLCDVVKDEANGLNGWIDFLRKDVTGEPDRNIEITYQN